MDASHVTQVVVVGGGIAGCWAALKLAERGIDTMLITYMDSDRGGVQGATGRSVGAINTSPLDKADFKSTLEELGGGQTHPSTLAALGEALSEELESIRAFAKFKKIKLGIALDSVSATELLDRIKQQFVNLGGRIVAGWVANIAVDDKGFQGVQFLSCGEIKQLYARNLVMASGGYAGLFEGAIKSPAYGALVGKYMQAGGAVTNLEFVFKHGYGKADLGTLTPTEELPGADVYDDEGTHVEWLEREFFSGKGTNNHLEAFRYWRNNNRRNYYIDFTHQPLYREILSLNQMLSDQSGNTIVDACIRVIVGLCREDGAIQAEQWIRSWIDDGGRIEYEHFSQLKLLHQFTGDRRFFRVSQLPYFSMGGVAHEEFKTNLPGVYVTGEAMHDFGANRVGGLPWGLYLIAGRRIAEKCAKDFAEQPLWILREFDLIPGNVQFDPVLLADIRARMREQMEDVFDLEKTDECITWFRNKRGELRKQGLILSDGYGWLVTAEAVLLSARTRSESRGCFFRKDYPQESDQFEGLFSLSTYDAKCDKVSTQLMDKHCMLIWVASSRGGAVYADIQQQRG